MSKVPSELESIYFDSIKELNEGEIATGKVICVTDRDVIVDVGYKSEGVIPRSEFEGMDLSKLGTIEVYVEGIEDEEGKVNLSFRKARESRGWRTLAGQYKEGDIVEGSVIRKVKGGYMVDVFGVEGFLPQSLSSFKNMEDSEVMSKPYSFQIVKMSKAKENFIISRKDALKMEKEQSRKKVWEEIKIGMVMKGRVKSITNFGAFIDLGGVDGLLHIADMSWKKITHPSEIVAVGDEVAVMILNFEKDKGKISLGLKQMTADPWTEIDKKYSVNSTLTGRITNIQNYGIFVELEKGIEGLIHISEISWTKKFMNLHEAYAIGDTVEVKVIGVDPAERKISLSVRQLEKDPWEDIEGMVTVDSQMRGKVVSYGEKCAYAELENGLEGVIYSEDISWTKKVVRAQDILKRGHAYDFKILGIDRENRRIIIGLKQLQDDPWPQIVERLPIGKVLEGEVVKVANFGVFVKIDEELEGLVFAGEIDKEAMDKLKPQDKLQVKIIKVDAGAAKIGLSARLDAPVSSQE